MRSRVKKLGFVLVVGAALFGCKQGEGDRCQITSDCEDGLICLPAEGVCRESGGGDIVDAAPPADAFPTPDARPEPDAEPEPDAAPADAGTGTST